MDIQILSKKEYEIKKEHIPESYILILDDNIKLKGVYDKRYKRVEYSQFNYFKFSSKPILNFHFYNSITKIKTRIKNSEKYLFVSDELKIQMEVIKYKKGFYYVEKNESKLESKFNSNKPN